jgi:Holliday junction resolvasome RuvABC endonuclease subunit
MKQTPPSNPRTLAISLSSRGFGFAVLEGERLVDWGVKSAKTDKNAQSLAKVEQLIVQYQPDVLVQQDHTAEDFRRSAKAKELSRQIAALALRHKVRVNLLSNQEVKKALLPDGEGTKHELAKLMAQRFPDELGLRLPPERRPWMSEDYRMGIFAAVALALTFSLKKGSG